MKIKTLLSITAACFALTSQAQIHPASLWNNTFIYFAVPHLNETWSASGYTLYNIVSTKDANGYLTSIQTATPPPFNVNMDQYKSIGSRTGNVFTASTQKQLKNTTAWFNWRNETWQGDGTNDTAVFWQDSISGAWTNVAKHVIHYNGANPDLTSDFIWSNNTWTPSSKMVITYVAGKRDKFTNYDWVIATSTWKQSGYVQYYYSTKLDSMLLWNTDPVTSVNTIKQKYYFVIDAPSGKTKSFTAYDWDATNSVWKNGITISFENGSTGVKEISSNDNQINIYPIPSDQILKIDFVTAKDAIIHIYDLIGKEVYAKEINAVHSEINTADMKNGIYIFSVEQNGKITEQRKFIVAH